MSIALAVINLPAIREVVQQAQDYERQSKAPNTIRAYRNDWADFSRWCAARGVESLPAPPQMVALYLTELAGRGYKASTLQRRMSAISQAHQAAEHDSPTQTPVVRRVMAGIRRVHGTAQIGKAPVMTEDLRAMVRTLTESLIGKRDRALLLVGFAGAFRRSEIVSLDVTDLAFSRDGLTITLRRSKTDQEGAGVVKGIPYGANPDTCPVRAVQGWLEASGLTSGPLFHPVTRHGRMQPARLSDKAVALVVKRTVEPTGLNPAQYAGHSLRAGLATSAAAAGVPERVIMDQTGHKSLNMVRKYIRSGSLFLANAAAQVGL